MLTSRIAAVLSFTALYALAAPARANCAAPVDYGAAVAGSTVTIAASDGTCPRSGGMLRENPSTGEIVELADFCGEADGSGNKPYVDECVPPGSYRYGFGTPYACSSSACGTYYFTEATVTDTLATSCARSAGNSAPTSVAEVPWGDDSEICGYGGSSGCSIGLPGGAMPVLGANLAALLVGLALMRRRAMRA
jgi:hypothetical protein